jgi:membrane associated rhomboid family serine protease
MPSNRNYSNTSNMSISLPPFRGAVKWLMLINLGVFIAWELLGLVSAESASKAALILGLIPQAVVHGWLWQIVTYGFLHLGVMHLAGNLLGIWFVGSLVEGMFGTRRFVRFYFICLLGAAIGCVVLSYSGAAPLSHAQLIAGATGANYGLLLAVGMLMGETEFMMFPLPMQIKAKYMVGIVLGIAVLMSLSGPGAIINAGLLGGLFAGFIYLKLWGRGRATSSPYATSGVGRGLSDRMYAVAPAKREPLLARMKNGYHRWKRRRMARKFEVYMRKHDRSVYFDEHGNYKGHEVPDDEKKTNGGEGRGGWVN